MKQKYKITYTLTGFALSLCFYFLLKALVSIIATYGAAVLLPVAGLFTILITMAGCIAILRK